MQGIDWNRLGAPFPAQAVVWRVVELAGDRLSARLEPQLSQQALATRLDDVCEPHGWSMRYRSIGQGIACELTVSGVTRTAVADPAEVEGAGATSLAAFAAAATLFGMRPPAPADGDVWVDYDPDEKQAMLPDTDVLIDEQPAQFASPIDEAAGSSDVQAAEAKPEGQQAIDRLVERLKQEGKGLEAAKLLVDHGGYGRDPETARELYRRLRELLSSVETRA